MNPSPSSIPSITPQSINDSLLKIPSLLEVGVNEVEHVILYGETGTGKTTLAALLSEFFHVLWFDGDKGLTAAINNCHPEMLKRIHVVKIPDSTDYPIMVNTILRVIKGTKTRICLEHGTTTCPICAQNSSKQQFEIALNELPKNWVVVMDSQTQFYTSTLAFAYYKDTKKEPGSGVPPDYKGNWDYRGIAYNICEMFGNYLKDLKCQWVSISHEVLTEQEDGTNKLVPVGGSRNVSMNYGRWFGTEVFAKKQPGKIHYITSAVHSGTVQTKSRSNVVLENELTPSLLHVFRPKEARELLKGSYNEWFLAEGWKPKEKRDPKRINPPQPKEVLSE